MQVSVESPNAIERRITVVVPVERIEQAYDKRIANLAKTAKVNGFRKGKIPLDYIKQYYGQTARQDALSEVIQSTLTMAINEQKLVPVGVPMVEPKTVIPGQPLEFVATFEVLPHIDSIQFELASLEKRTATIQDSDVDYVINHLLQQNAEWKEVDNRSAQEKDRVIIDFLGSIEGKAFKNGEAHDYPIVLGSKTMISGFEEGLVGMQIGEEKILPLIFPEKYFAKELEGKTAEFSVKMKKILEPVLPTLDEAFVKKMGVKTGEISDLRDEVRKNLERELKRIVNLQLKNQVFEVLIQQNPLDIPKAVIEREAKRIHDQLHPHHAKDQQHSHTVEEMEKFNESAKRNVALGLMIGKLIKDHQIALDKDKIQAYLMQLSGIYEKPDEIINWYKNDKNARAEVEMQILEEQLVEKLLEKVVITEKVSSYTELVRGVQK